MLSELALLTAIVAAVTFVGQLRRSDARQRGYVIVLGGVVALSIVAAVRADRFLAVVAMGLVGLVVVAPWLLDLAVRALFARERLAWAVRLAGWRALLMPGAGLHRQQVILRGLALLEQRGVDGALRYFRSLASESDDDAELRIIHEQIVSMLLFGQRWDEGIAYYEARFSPRYAASRPPLALGLMRAYGEAGRLDHAAVLMRAIEELLGRDPRAGGMVGQARLTFLAYMGRSGPVAQALTDAGRRRLGLSAASGALFRGIALSRAGHPGEAQAELHRVEDLAGVRDGRVVVASRKAIAALEDEPASLECGPELRTYSERVAERLKRYLEATPSVRRSGSLMVTPCLLVVIAAGYVGLWAMDAGGPGLLRLGGAQPQRVLAGSWGRLFTGVTVQVEPIALLLCIYGVWLAGPLVERIYGRGRAVLVSLGAAAVGLGGACVVARDPSAVYSGGALLTTGMLGAALSVLLSPRTNLPRRTRRVLALPLLLLLASLAVMIPREAEGLDVPALGMILAAVVGALGVAVAPPLGRRATALRVAGASLVLAGIVGAVEVAREDVGAFTLEHRISRRADGIELRVPLRFALVTEPDESSAGPWPVYPGLHDRLAQRVGDRVQLVVTPADPLGERPCALLRIDDALVHELLPRPGPPPPRWLEAYRRRAGEASADRLRTTVVRRNGRDVGVVIERPVDGGETAIALLAAPVEALDRDPELYAAVFAGARRDEP